MVCRGIHNQDLLSLAEANKDFKMDGTIHWEKFRLMGETILAMIRFQEPRFSIQPDARILGFIAETELMNEDVRGTLNISGLVAEFVCCINTVA
jgi:hypothetical protein